MFDYYFQFKGIPQYASSFHLQNFLNNIPLGGPSGLLALDPSATPSLQYIFVNYTELRLRVYQVKPEEWTGSVYYQFDYDNTRTEPISYGFFFKLKKKFF